MGLIERRKIRELQDTIIPGRVKEIEEICGKAIQYDVDWETMSDSSAALNVLDNLSCHHLNMTLRTLCQDNMGKMAVRDGLKLIKLRNVREKNDVAMTFTDGTLEMHCAYALGADGMISDNDIRALLEQKL